MILKRAALLWMRSEYAADAREEVDCLVGRADVFSPSAAWIAECGKTGVSKLVTAVASGEPIRFSLIPYQWATWDDETTARRLIAVEFSWTPEFSQQVAQAARDADARFPVEQTGPDASTKVGTVGSASRKHAGEA
ncbi:hypothetical protein ASG52_19955 [Methylobacterium sp. Leaf456]|nr:hypothetical protein ASG52_19955 [Methylobacterium sp. Leaf456]